MRTSSSAAGRGGVQRAAGRRRGPTTREARSRPSHRPAPTRRRCVSTRPLERMADEQAAARGLTRDIHARSTGRQPNASRALFFLGGAPRLVVGRACKLPGRRVSHPSSGAQRTEQQRVARTWHQRRRGEASRSVACGSYTGKAGQAGWRAGRSLGAVELSGPWWSAWRAAGGVRTAGERPGRRMGYQSRPRQVEGARKVPPHLCRRSPRRPQSRQRPPAGAIAGASASGVAIRVPSSLLVETVSATPPSTQPTSQPRPPGPDLPGGANGAALDLARRARGRRPRDAGWPKARRSPRKVRGTRARKRSRIHRPEARC